jgi:glycosyltransferase involved in cell wall biosynthesis
MNVLWVTNPIFPELAHSLGLDKPVVGGWMYGLAEDLKKTGVNLTVVTTRQNIAEHRCKVNDINYYLVSGKTKITAYDSSLEKKWQQIIDEVRPDIVHIHGTEYAFGLALIKACPEIPVVISIQGLTHVIARYYTAGISTMDILRNIAVKDILKGSTILNAQKQYAIRGEKIEKKYLKLARHIIGRTRWDLAHTKSVNPNITYHFCNESLRDGFYIAKKWNSQNKINHTLFLSQAGYPIKGLHKVLEAANVLKHLFPDLKIRIAGNDIMQESGSFTQKLKIDGYGKYIKSLVKRFKLANHITFLGALTEEQMILEYLGCHVFVCPSNIENSPNSLGEAQLLGVPCVASYVGGIPDMVDDGVTGLLYRFGEVEMMAQHIGAIFNDDLLATKLSEHGIKAATLRHDRTTNRAQLYRIYQLILSQ